MIQSVTQFINARIKQIDRTVVAPRSREELLDVGVATLFLPHGCEVDELVSSKINVKFRESIKSNRGEFGDWDAIAAKLCGKEDCRREKLIEVEARRRNSIDFCCTY